MSNFVNLVDFEEMAAIYAFWGNCPMFPGSNEQLIEISGAIPIRHQLYGATTMQEECRREGHKQLHDCSSAEPDSGNMDHECLHCGTLFRHQLY